MFKGGIMELYSQENLERLMQECYDEIESKFKDTYYNDEFNFKKDSITIQAKPVGNSRVLGNCHFDSLEYCFDYWGRKQIKEVKKATITIFKHLNRTERGIKETIIHELIHTLKNCQNHKSEFKYKCYLIQTYLGYSCLNGQQEDTKSVEYLDNFVHFLTCEHCHKVLDKGVKFTNKYKHPETRICGICKGNVKYKSLEQVKEWL